MPPVTRKSPSHWDGREHRLTGERPREGAPAPQATEKEEKVPAAPDRETLRIEAEETAREIVAGMAKHAPSLRYVGLTKQGTLDLAIDGKRFEARLDAQKRFRELWIGGRAIRCEPPIEQHAIERTVANAETILQHLRKSPIAKEITAQTPHRMLGSLRMEVTIERDGAVVVYVATTKDLLRLTSNPPLTNEERDELQKLKNKLQGWRRNFYKEYSMRDVVAPYFPRDGYLRQFKPDERKTKEAELDEMIADIRQTQERYAAFDHRDGSRVLVDDAKGLRVFEKSDETSPEQYDRLYVNAAGRSVRDESFRRGGPGSVTEYANDRKRSRLYFHENGAVRERIEYAVDGRDYARVQTYRADGTLLSDRRVAEGYADFYDTKEKPAYRILFADDFTPKRKLLYDEKGALFDPLEKSIEGLRRAIKTKDAYMQFEELFIDMNDRGKRDTRVIAMRAHGKELFGIADAQKELETRHGIVIDTEGAFLNDDYETRLAAMPVVERQLKVLARELAKYPPGFLRASDINMIAIRSGEVVDRNRRRNEDSLFRPSVAGFYEWQSRTFLFTDQSTDIVIHHELFHGVDYQETRTLTPNEWWKDRQKGRTDRKQENSDFARQYGQTNPKEDRATIAEELFHSERARILRARAAQQQAAGQPTLAEKVRRVELSYYVISDGKMDATFWQDILRGETINDAYWQRRTAVGDFVKDSEGEQMRKRYGVRMEVRREVAAAKALPAGDARNKALLQAYLKSAKEDPSQAYEYTKEYLDICDALPINAKIAALEAWIAASDRPFSYMFTTLVELYEKVGRIDDAIRLLEHKIEVWPDEEAYCKRKIAELRAKKR